MNLALHGARLASARRTGLGRGCWPRPRPIRLASDAPVIGHRIAPTTDQDRFPDPSREGRTVATIRSAFCQPGIPSRDPSVRQHEADELLGACSLMGPEGPELDLVPGLCHEPGLWIGHC